MRYHTIPNPSYKDIETDIKEEIRFRTDIVLSRLDEHYMILVRRIRLRKRYLDKKISRLYSEYRSRLASDPLSELLVELDSNVLRSEKNIESYRVKVMRSLNIRKGELSEWLENYLKHLPKHINEDTDITDELAKEVADGVIYKLQLELESYRWELSVKFKKYKECIGYEIDSLISHLRADINFRKLTLEVWSDLPEF